MSAASRALGHAADLIDRLADHARADGNTPLLLAASFTAQLVRDTAHDSTWRERAMRAFDNAAAWAAARHRRHTTKETP